VGRRRGGLTFAGTVVMGELPPSGRLLAGGCELLLGSGRGRPLPCTLAGDVMLGGCRCRAPSRGQSDPPTGDAVLGPPLLRALTRASKSLVGVAHAACHRRNPRHER
jgi:hypothetical protein